MAAKWDRVMLAQRVSRSRTIRRLDDAEFRSFIAALCLAGESPVRGCLLVSEGEPLTAHDIADEAGVDEAVVESMVSKLLQLDTLTRDDVRGCLRFVNWSNFNPAPRPSDSREATRERKRRQRAREADKKRREKDSRQTRMGRSGSALRTVDDAPPATIDDLPLEECA